MAIGLHSEQLTPPALRARAVTKTSPTSIREQVFDCIVFSDGLTPDEVAQLLSLSVLTVRPRCSELLRRGRLVDSGDRRSNDSGRLAKVLVVSNSEPVGISAHSPALHLAKQDSAELDTS